MKHSDGRSRSIHCPLINNEDGQKLSKRCGHSSYEDLVEQGFLTEAIVNFVALLGWSPAEEREIYALPELVKAFDYCRSASHRQFLTW